MLLKTVSFTLILLLGAFFRKQGYLSAPARDALTAIVMQITLPAAILTGFSVETFDPSYLWIIFAGFMLNLLMIGIGYTISRGQPVRDRITSCLAMTGYSIGSFALPFTQEFLSGNLLTVVCLFDLGNAFMTLGGTKLLVSRLFGGDCGKGVSGFLRKLLSSPSLIIEIVMVFSLLSGYRVPAAVLTVAKPLANANFFLYVLLVGSMLRFDITWAQLKQISRYQVIRCLFVLAFALLFYAVLPYDREIVLAVILASRSPISIMSTIYAEQCGGDSGLSGLTGSINVFLSIVMMFAVLALF